MEIFKNQSGSSFKAKFLKSLFISAICLSLFLPIMLFLEVIIATDAGTNSSLATLLLILGFIFIPFLVNYIFFKEISLKLFFITLAQAISVYIILIIGVFVLIPIGVLFLSK